MAKKNMGVGEMYLPDPSAPWELPKAFQAGAKYDIITPIETSNESLETLQAKGSAILRGQLGSLQGTVAGLQQTAREGIDAQIQPGLTDLGNLIQPAVGAITRGLGEVMEYSAGLGVSPQGDFSGAPATQMAGQNSASGGGGHAIRKVKPGEIGSIDQLHSLIRSGQISERSNANGDRSYYWGGQSSGGGGGGSNSGGSSGPKIASNIGPKSGGSLASEVSRVTGLVQKSAQTANTLQQTWAAEGGAFDGGEGIGQGFASGGLPAPGISPAGMGVNPFAPFPAAGNIAGMAGQVIPGVVGGAGNVVGDWCALITVPGDPTPKLMRVIPGITVLPPGVVIVAGPSRELCGVVAAANRPPIDLPHIGAPGVPVPHAGPVGPPPGAAPPPHQDLVGPREQRIPGRAVPCPSDECTYDIRRGQANPALGGPRDIDSASEGADDSTTKRITNKSWQSYSSVSGDGPYVLAPGQTPRNLFDCKLAEGPNKACVEAVAESVSGVPTSDGKSKSAEQYTTTLGANVTLALCDGFEAQVISPDSIEGKTFSQIVGLADKDKNPTWVDKPLSSINIAGQVVFGSAKLVNKILDIVLAFPVQLTAFGSCDDIRLTPVYISQAIFGFAGRWLGFTPNTPNLRFAQAENLLCTPMLPSAENAIEGKLANQITEGEYKCWTEASGMPKTLWDKILQSRKSRLPPEQLFTLWRRGDIDYSQLESRLRELGWIDPKTTEEMEVLTRQYPGMQDIVRFMVRDVDDEKVVGQFGLSDKFPDKYQGRLRGWAKQQGIPDDVALAFWQSHWTIPSPGQLYEMYHRLRHKPEYGGPEVFKETIRTALVQQDILPYWIDKLMAVSFRPLTRVDTRRAFDLGVIDRAQVIQSYQDSGYSDENAETLTRFTEKNRRKSWKNLWYVKAAIAGQLSFDGARVEATGDDQQYEMLQWMTKYVPRQIELNRVKVCLGFIRKRYLRGELDEQQLVVELAKAGVANQLTEQISKGWQCEKGSKSKIISASQLCKLHAQRIITLQQFQDALHNLGYTAEQTLRLLASCVQGIEMGERKKLEAGAKAQAALAERIRKSQIKENADLTREGKAQAKRLEALQRRRESLAAAIADAAEKLGKKTGEGMVQSLQQVKSLVKRLQIERGFREGDAVAQAQIAVDAAEAGKPADLWALAFAAPLATLDTV